MPGDAFALRNQFALKIDYEEEPPIFQITDAVSSWLEHPLAPRSRCPRSSCTGLTDEGGCIPMSTTMTSPLLEEVKGLKQYFHQGHGNVVKAVDGRASHRPGTTTDSW